MRLPRIIYCTVFDKPSAREDTLVLYVYNTNRQRICNFVSGETFCLRQCARAVASSRATRQIDCLSTTNWSNSRSAVDQQSHIPYTFDCFVSSRFVAVSTVVVLLE